MKLTGRTAFLNCKLILAKMFEYSREMSASEVTQYGYPSTDPDETVRLFIGLLKTVAQEVGVNETSISQATGVAKAMRCITPLRMAGRGSNSIYIMHYMPTDEDFDKYRENRDETSIKVAPNKMQRYETELAAVRVQLRDVRSVFESFREIMFQELERHRTRIEELERGRRTDVRGSETLS